MEASRQLRCGLRVVNFATKVGSGESPFLCRKRVEEGIGGVLYLSSFWDEMQMHGINIRLDQVYPSSRLEDQDRSLWDVEHGIARRHGQQQ